MLNHEKITEGLWCGDSLSFLGSVAGSLDTKDGSAEIQELQKFTLKFESSGALVCISCAKPELLP